MTLVTAGSNAVFGLQVVRRAAAATAGQAYLTRPHTIGSSVDIL